MLTTLKSSLWQHFGASIDMLQHAIELCPEKYWDTSLKFYYLAYHTTVFLDYYLTMPPGNFKALLPYTLTEPGNIPADAIDDIVPDKIYTQQELLNYLQTAREKCRQVIASLTEERLQERWLGESEEVDLSLAGRDTLTSSVLDILFYNMRHVQHHTAQLNLLLRQTINKAPEWVSHAGDNI
ncbi:MAG: DinB family protein [Niastella sp.]|nr:DinB family protein [Niastella sp.]